MAGAVEHVGTASVAEHIGTAGTAKRIGVAKVTEQQTTMAGVSSTLGLAGHRESHATSTTCHGSDTSIRGHI